MAKAKTPKTQPAMLVSTCPDPNYGRVELIGHHILDITIPYGEPHKEINITRGGYWDYTLNQWTTAKQITFDEIYEPIDTSAEIDGVWKIERLEDSYRGNTWLVLKNISDNKCYYFDAGHAIKVIKDVYPYRGKAQWRMAGTKWRLEFV